MIMKSSEIRQKFLDFFASKGHRVVPSSSLIPANDPTLLFTNAGMVQFKDIFLGTVQAPYSSATSSQLCLRVGGKHNDLENVGHTARHHTLFEMLGNFSFGDYFKREAINYAWNFLTKELGLPPEKLWITVYKDDDEAADIWLKEIGISPERFSRCGEKDNFWSMGDTGPCGPCSEIFYDHGAEIFGGPPGTKDADGDRYIEIWNLVFMQYNRDKSGTLHPLPKPSVDTGMGLERISAVMQHVNNNYDIDSFATLINAIASLHHDIDKTSPSLKVIADHIRACVFLIHDGIVPGNEGRGYVLRRIIRRAVRHGHLLGIPSPFFHQLVEPLLRVMGDAYPSLKEQKAHIQRILKQEEEQFMKTLDQGLRLLEQALSIHKGKILPGDLIFKLYDTYGFPVDLTADTVRDRGLTVDMDGFNSCMEKQRAMSQASSQFTIDYTKNIVKSEPTIFLGYDEHAVDAVVLELFVGETSVSSISPGTEGWVILNTTPFYGESGGQVGDTGYLHGKGMVFDVTDTKKIGERTIHIGTMREGTLSLDEPVKAHINIERREAIRLNHTATHLVHAALRKLLGTHVQQKGSLVNADRTRFDFTHYEGLTSLDCQKIEFMVNAEIRANYPVITQKMTFDEAKASGAIALFDEKYGDDVRVLSIGEFSKELCGGTHARRTGDIGLFKVIAEYGIANGVRRIELMTGNHALEWVNDQLSLLSQAATQLKTSPLELHTKLVQLFDQNKEKDKIIHQLNIDKARLESNALLEQVTIVDDVKVLVHRFDADSQTLRALMEVLRSKIEESVIVLYSIQGDQLFVHAAVHRSLADKVGTAAKMVQYLCGRGGGRDDTAQGGGVVPDNLDERINTIKALFQ